MSSVTGYVFEGIDGKMHFSLDVADQKLIAKLRRYLTDAASFAMNHSDYEQAVKMICMMQIIFTA